MKEKNKVVFSTPHSLTKKKLNISKSASKLPNNSHRGKAFPPPPQSPSDSIAVQNLRQLSATLLTPRRKAFSAETADCNATIPPKLENDKNGVSSINVAVRVRPFSKQELDLPGGDLQAVHISSDGNKVIVTNPKRGHQRLEFVFDHVFWSVNPNDLNYADQENVYSEIGRPLLDHAYQGFNVCLFAYGITSTGKSYSIMGNPEAPGIVNRLVDDLFRMKDDIESKSQETTIKLELSYLEIYNEKIHDLLILDNSLKKQNLSVREHPVTGPFVEGLSKYEVLSPASVLEWIDVGNRVRITAATGQNDHSSRSHSLITITLTKKQLCHVSSQTFEETTTCKINIIDLAGSEKQKTSLCEGERLLESSNINKSLLALGKVISSLSECHAASSFNNAGSFGDQDRFISYRDSVLTRLLKESLGGNSKTTMLATISPSSVCIEETVNTLRYAKKAQSIVNLPRVNEDANVSLLKDLLMKDIREKQVLEIDDFKSKLSNKDAEILSLKGQLDVLLKELEKKNEEICNKTNDILDSPPCLVSTETQSNDINQLFEERFSSEIDQMKIKLYNEAQLEMVESLREKDQRISRLFVRLTSVMDDMVRERTQYQKRIDELLEIINQSKSNEQPCSCSNQVEESVETKTPSPAYTALKKFRLVEKSNLLVKSMNLPLIIKTRSDLQVSTKRLIQVMNSYNNQSHYFPQDSLDKFVYHLDAMKTILINESSPSSIEVNDDTETAPLVHSEVDKENMYTSSSETSSPKNGSKRSAYHLTSPSPHDQSSIRCKILRDNDSSSVVLQNPNS